MSEQFTITAVAPNGEPREKTFEVDEVDPQAKKNELEGMGFTDVEIESESSVASDGGVEVVDEPHEADLSDEPSVSDDPLAQLGEELGTDPLEILPSHMIDNIRGEPAVNKRGYAMIAERYGIEASADVVELPWNNEESRCVAKATAITEDGKEYSGWATACAADGDMEDQLIELAETRALKRCVSWASGVGIVSYQELASELE